MDSLPIEIKSFCCDLVPHEDRNVLSLCSKFFNKYINESIDKVIDILKIANVIKNKNITCRQKYVYNLLYNSCNVSFVDFLSLNCANDRIFHLLGARGHKNIMENILDDEKKEKIDWPSFIKGIILSENIELLIWTLLQIPEERSDKIKKNATIFRSAIRKGNLKIMKLLNKNKFLLRYKKSIAPELAKNEDILRWYIKKGYPTCGELCYQVVKLNENYSDVVEWMIGLGIRCGFECQNELAEKGNILLLKLIYESKEPLSSDIYSYALNNNHYELMIWLKQVGCAWNYSDTVPTNLFALLDPYLLKYMGHLFPIPARRAIRCTCQGLKQCVEINEKYYYGYQHHTIEDLCGLRAKAVGKDLLDVITFREKHFIELIFYDYDLPQFIWEDTRQYPVNRIATCSYEIYVIVSQRGNLQLILNLFDYFIENYSGIAELKKEKLETLIIAIIERNNIYVLKRIYQKIKNNIEILTLIKNCHCFSTALSKSSIEIAEWMIKKNFAIDKNSIGIAILCNRLDFAQKLLNIGVKWDKMCYVNAIYLEQIDSLIWLKENDCPWGTVTFSKIREPIKNNKVIMDWLINNGCP